MKPLFRGNYGGPLGSYATAGQLYAQKGQALGQAFQSVGTSVAEAMEKRKVAQEKKDKETALAQQYQGMFENNPEFLIEMGGDPNDPESIKLASQTAAKHPQAFQVAQVAHSMGLQRDAAEREQERLNIAKRREEQQSTLFPMQEKVARVNLAAAEEKQREAADLKRAQMLQPYVQVLPDGTKRLSEDVPADLANKAIRLHDQQSLAREQAKLKMQSELADMNKTIAETQEIVSRISDTSGTAGLGKIEDNKKAIRNTSITIEGLGSYTFGELLDMETSPDKDVRKQWKDVAKRIRKDGPYSRAKAAHEALEAKEQAIIKSSTVTVEDSQTADTPTPTDTATATGIVTEDMTREDARQAVAREIEGHRQLLDSAKKRLQGTLTIGERKGLQSEIQRHQKAIRELKQSEYSPYPTFMENVPDVLGY